MEGGAVVMEVEEVVMAAVMEEGIMVEVVMEAGIMEDITEDTEEDMDTAGASMAMEEVEDGVGLVTGLPGSAMEQFLSFPM
jgi:hypothetical protein